jgi:GNAT superfamily N-acetyltransferase
MHTSTTADNPVPPRRTDADKVLLSEGRFRAFTLDDIPVIASLYDRLFSRGEGKPSDRLCDYFEGMFFKHPWADPLVKCWIYETNQGDVKAFTGSRPVRMMFDGQLITAAAGGYSMVTEDYQGRGLGSLLMRYDSEQEAAAFSCSDASGGFQMHVCESYCGSARVQVAGVQWEFALRGSRLDDVTGTGSKIMRLPNRIVNEMKLRRRRARIEQQLKGAQISEVAPDIPERLPEMLPKGTRLYPLYDAEYISWLMKTAAFVFSRGNLRHSTVLNEKGDDIDGWYFLWVPENDRAEALQIVSRQGAEERVLAQLIGHADREGATSVAGPWLGNDILVAAQNMGCHIGYIPTRTLIRSRNSEIMRAFMSGRYFMSAFEFDSWLNLNVR